MMRYQFMLLVSCLAVLCGARGALADEVGAIGPVAGLQINTTSADTYLAFNGRVYVKNPDGMLDEYRWGGVACSTKVLTVDQVAALQRAMDNKQMQIQPLHLAGQGQIRCLVGFTIVPKKNIALVLP